MRQARFACSEYEEDFRSLMGRRRWRIQFPLCLLLRPPLIPLTQNTLE